MKKSPLKKIWKKRRNRKSESEVFKEISKRWHICEVCWWPLRWLYWDPTREYYAYMFAHLLSKWLYPEYRVNLNNIFLVCSIECHTELDLLTAWKKIRIRDKLDKWIKINIEDIKNYL